MSRSAKVTLDVDAFPNWFKARSVRSRRYRCENRDPAAANATGHFVKVCSACRAIYFDSTDKFVRS